MRKGEDNKNKELPLIRENFPVERKECLSSLSLDLELDSDSEDEMSTGMSAVDTVTEGEMGDVSNDATEESMDEREEVGEGSGLQRKSGPYKVEEEEEESSDGEDTMSPLRLDTDDDSYDESEEEKEEEEEEEEEERKDFWCSHVQRCEKTKRRSSGMPYRNPHNHLKGKTGAVPQYKCEWCGRMFLRRYYLRQHYVLHQQVPHQCQLCGKVFMSLRYLKRHLKAKHDN